MAGGVTVQPPPDRRAACSSPACSVERTPGAPQSLLPSAGSVASMSAKCVGFTLVPAVENADATKVKEHSGAGGLKHLVTKVRQRAGHRQLVADLRHILVGWVEPGESYPRRVGSDHRCVAGPPPGSHRHARRCGPRSATPCSRSSVNSYALASASCSQGCLWNSTAKGSQVVIPRDESRNENRPALIARCSARACVRSGRPSEPFRPGSCLIGSRVLLWHRPPGKACGEASGKWCRRCGAVMGRQSAPERDALYVACRALNALREALPASGCLPGRFRNRAAAGRPRPGAGV